MRTARGSDDEMDGVSTWKVLQRASAAIARAREGRRSIDRRKNSFGQEVRQTVVQDRRGMC